MLEPEPGTLYLVATPIGNLQDISARAIETLSSVDLIACEDTRHTRKLLNHFGIATKAVSYHEHNESERAAELINLLSDGQSVAVVSDAGTPGISDPGFAVVRQAAEAGITVIPVPGPVAFVNALIVSGLPSDGFFFGGFLPSKKGERVKRLSELATTPGTLIFYEAPHRIAASLADCADVLGDRKAAVVRELTKIHEETVRGTLFELKARFSAAKTRGELVIVIDKDNGGRKAPVKQPSLIERLDELERSGVDRKTALKTAAKEYGLGKSEAYRMVEAKKKAGQ
ncbi:MAG: 16S rRNA (cytidine(1402)-2'-O)-methyltransferase [Acidobacteriota bacterium]